MKITARNSTKSRCITKIVSLFAAATLMMAATSAAALMMTATASAQVYGHPKAIKPGNILYALVDTDRVFMCWQQLDYCSVFTQANHKGTANLCPQLMHEKSLTSMVEFLRRHNSNGVGAGHAGFQDCRNGLGYWLGKLCIDVPSNGAQSTYTWCSYVAEDRDMRITKDDLLREMSRQASN
jgi:hypothetical protein